MNPRTITTVAVAAILLALAGCTNDPEPAPTTTAPQTSTAEPEEHTPDPQRAADQAAIQAYKDFIAAYNQFGQGGYSSADAYDNVMRFVATDDYATKLADELDPRMVAGAHQTGEVKVSVFKVVERKPNTDIVLEVCQDTSDFDVVLPDGSSMLRAGTTGRWVTTVEMWQTYTNVWGVGAASTDRGRPCGA